MSELKPNKPARQFSLPGFCGPLIALLCIYGIFALVAPSSFTNSRSIETMLRQSAIVSSAAIGMTLVIIMGGIDLSVGSIIALTTVIIADSLRDGSSPISATLLGLLIASLCGAMNGIIITRFKLSPFIATLGSLLVIRGLAKGLADEQKIDAPLSYLNSLLAPLAPLDRWQVVAPGVWIVIGLALTTLIILRRTRFGVRTIAIGSNERTARLCGISVESTKIAVYTLSGLLAGVGGLLQFSRLTVGDPTAAAGLELDAVAAVVIGGGSLSGGEASVIGTLIGALVMTVIRSGCAQMGISTWIQEILTGVIIITAVALDRFRHREQ